MAATGGLVVIKTAPVWCSSSPTATEKSAQCGAVTDRFVILQSVLCACNSEPNHPRSERTKDLRKGRRKFAARELYACRGCIGRVDVAEDTGTRLGQ